MPCFHPLSGFRAVTGGITWNRGESTGLPMQVPCGQCIGCRLERSRQWAVRCMHEASLHDDNCFITLTYADEFLPRYGHLDKRAFPLFMKRLRKRIAPRRVRYYMCGEYGKRYGRPHYHAALFGFDFPDKVRVESGKPYPEWESELLAKLWPYGRSLIGSVTFESAAYIARYIVDKVNGDLKEFHYEEVDPGTGEIVERVPEFSQPSRRPGIGGAWFERFGGEVFPADSVVVRGRLCRPPRYYLERVSPEVRKGVAKHRRESRDRAEESADRLSVREVCCEAQLTLFSRELDV